METLSFPESGTLSKSSNYRVKAPLGVWGIKKATSHKPDSVVGYHLSVPKVADRNQAAYPVSRTSRSQTILYVAFQHARFTRK